MSTTSRRTGFFAVVIREWQRIARSPFHVMMLLGFPLLGGWLIVATFGTGAARDLPIAVVDCDESPLSRDFVRMLDASGGIRTSSVGPDMGAAERLVLGGEVYGVVSIPQHFERDVARGAAPVVTAFYNAQYVLPASQIKSALAATTGTLSARIEIRQRAAARELPPAAIAHVEPITLDVHTLFNTSLNYITYLVSALLPALLQVFIATITVHAYGAELRDDTAREWFEAAGGRALPAIAGKAVPYVVHFTALGLLMLAALYGWLGVPFHGSFAAAALATGLFVLAYIAMGFAFAAATGELRFGTSIAAFYCAPAFAFAGVTFPVEGMPVVGQAWSSLLPVTHYLRILVQQGMRGAPVEASWPSVLALAAFCAAPWPFLGWRMARLARSTREGRGWC
jgi:ABC-2 type transport system permease protein